MKKLLSFAALCSLMMTTIGPSLAADVAGPVNTSSTSSTTSSSSSSNSSGNYQYMAPNYWGDSRVRDRSTASQSQSSSSTPMQQSSGSRGGSGGSSMGMLAPMMMVPMLMMGRGAPIKGLMNRGPKKKNSDEEKEEKRRKKQAKRAMQQESQQEPAFTAQPMSALSRQTFDLQNGAGGQPAVDPRMSVSGVVENPEPAAGNDF